MKVTGISMVRNEADVIEAFVRHHAEVLDELVVVDHCSADGTGDLLAALAAEGLPVEVRREESFVQRQNVVLTGLMREAARAGGADWVLPLDADEFLIAPSGNVRSALERLTDERPSAIDMRFYVPTPDDPADEPNVLQRLRHRVVLEGDMWRRKVVVPARWARNGRFSLAQGNHVLVDGRTGRYSRTSFTDRLALAHFPVRSQAQLARKVLGGWPAHLARPERPPTGAFQWRRAFQAVVAGRRMTARRLHALAIDYAVLEPDGRPELVHDPVPSRFRLRYDVPRQPPPLQVLADTAVGLAEELSQTLRKTKSR